MIKDVRKKGDKYRGKETRMRFGRETERGEDEGEEKGKESRRKHGRGTEGSGGREG